MNKSEWSNNGITAWHGMVTSWFDSLSMDRVAVEVEVIEVAATDQLAAAHAFITCKDVSADGGKLHAIQNRLMWYWHARADKLPVNP